MSILVIAEMRQGELRSATLPVVSAAKALSAVNGQPFDILVMGTGAQGATDALKGLGGANVYYSEAAAVADYTAEAYAAATQAVIGDKGHTVVMTPATTTGKDMMPRLAGLLDAGMVSDVIGFDGDCYLRPMYAGNAIAKVAVSSDVAILTVRETAFDAAEGGAGDAAVSEASFDVTGDGAAFIEFKLTDSSRPDLAEADVVVSVGRGVKDADGVAVGEQLADLLGAALGASRAVVDEGFLPNDLQVGQTGKIVAPDLYIACGISGAIQHVAGMKDSKTIVAINKDEEAPIFEVADYGLVADYAKVVPELIEKIKAVQG
jgi:electron transfer flavoprotein alpha subunit